jgi:hypothetical protein
MSKKEEVPEKKNFSGLRKRTQGRKEGKKEGRRGERERKAKERD